MTGIHLDAALVTVASLIEQHDAAQIENDTDFPDSC